MKARNVSSFYELPRRIFLDSSTLQTLQDYGGFIWEGEALPEPARIGRDPHGVAKLEALRAIFFVNQRANFEFALSDNSLAEVSDKGDPLYLTWAYDVLDHSNLHRRGRRLGSHERSTSGKAQ